VTQRGVGKGEGVVGKGPRVDLSPRRMDWGVPRHDASYSPRERFAGRVS
jgi:hypothetical protein